METQKILVFIEQHAHHFLQDIYTEYDGEKEAAAIICKYILDGKITPEEEMLLKTQLADSLKIIGVGIPFVLIPGASIIMPVLIKVAAKYNIQLMPSAFNNQENDNQSLQQN